MSRKTGRITNQLRKANERILDSLELPQDVNPGVTHVTLTGDREAWIENYRGLLEVTDSCIRIRCRSGSIRIEGARLSVDYFSDEDMKISGKLSSIHWS